MEKNEHTLSESYFAAMNTANGFCGKFKEIFGSLDRLYIIKGGPGTGKSRFMKDIGIAAEAKNSDFEVEYFYCSSDPSSLDGIIITKHKNNRSIGFIDGTAPHTYDPKLPGVSDSILNFGDFWNEKALLPHFSELKALGAAKSELFESVYSYLSAIEKLDKITCSVSQNALNIKKMNDAIDRLFREIPSGNGYAEKVRIRSAVSPDGIVKLDTFSRLASANYAVTDRAFAAKSFMIAVKAKLKMLNQEVVISYDPFFPTVPDAIFIPSADISVYIGSEPRTDEKTVNMSRFISDDILSPFKPKLRAISRLRRDLLDLLYADFMRIRTLHGQTEKIYIQAMDFSAKEELRDNIINKLFNEFD